MNTQPKRPSAVGVFPPLEPIIANNIVSTISNAVTTSIPALSTKLCGDNSNYQNIPDFMRSLPQWTIFAVGKDAKGKKAKMPMEGAKPDSPETWMSFEVANEKLELYRQNGIRTPRLQEWQQIDGYHLAFALAESDGLFALDLDTYQVGGDPAVANTIIEQLNSYTERSVSGLGSHVFGFGQVPESFVKRHGLTGGKFGNGNWLELYHHKRFIVMTGNVDPGHQAVLRPCQTELDLVLECYEKPGVSATSGNHLPPSQIERRSSLTHEQVLDALGRAPKGSYYVELLAGKDYSDEDQSGLDFGLACKLAFYTNGDATLMSQILLSSPRAELRKDKWLHRKDYLPKTISRAIDEQAGAGKWYSPCDSSTLELVAQIRSRLTELLELPACSENIELDESVIAAMLQGTYWSAAKSRFQLLNHADELVWFKENEAAKFLCRAHGYPFSRGQLQGLVRAQAKELGLTPAKAEKLMKQVLADPLLQILDHIKYHQQRDKLEMQVDMFSAKGRIELLPHAARVVFPHRPFESTQSAPNTEVIGDFKEHFPELDDVLDLIVHARFATDRKKAYLWLKCRSDWGKGFFLSVLEKLGITVNLSVKEVERMFEGGPVGRDMDSFKNAMVLSVDEFKGVKSELKQLQNHIELAPKHQLTVKAEIFTKLFTSAEGVESLAGDHGVEDQFSNRFSLIEGHHSIEQRPVFQNVGKAVYFKAVHSYVVQYLNKQISFLIGLGREGAEARADEYVSSFHQRYGIDRHYKRLSASLLELADEFKGWVRDRANADRRIVMDKGHYYVKNRSAVFSDFMQETMIPAERATIRRKRDEILALVSVDGRGNHNYRVNGQAIKAVKMEVMPPVEHCIALVPVS